ncbi:hypothetical protein HAX54_050693, partial [Datura stramonium]|nr:hypothetical protein [Datura stramonium]
TVVQIGKLRSSVSGILPGYVCCSGMVSVTADPLQWYSFHCSEFAAARQLPLRRYSLS